MRLTEFFDYINGLKRSTKYTHFYPSTNDIKTRSKYLKQKKKVKNKKKMNDLYE